MDKIETLLKIIFVGGAVSLLGFLTIQNGVLEHQKNIAQEKIKMLNAEIDKQDAAIEEMKDEASRQISRLLAAQESAKKERATYEKKAKNLLAQKVSTSCEEAIDWGIEQGARIYECWLVNDQNA